MAQILGITTKRYNMYRTGKVIDFPDDKEKSLVRGDFIFKKSVLDSTYTVRHGDTLWSIAYSSYLGRVAYPSRYWFILGIANDIHEPTDISHLVGTDIIIPDLSTFELNN